MLGLGVALSDRDQIVAGTGDVGATRPTQREVRAEPAMPVLERGLLLFRRRRGRRQQLAGDLGKAGDVRRKGAFADQTPRRHREHREQSDGHENGEPDAPVESMDAMARGAAARPQRGGHSRGVLRAREDVTRAAHSDDPFRVARIVFDCCTDARNMYIDRTIEGLERLTPHQIH